MKFTSNVLKLFKKFKTKTRMSLSWDWNKRRQMELHASMLSQPQKHPSP